MEIYDTIFTSPRSKKYALVDINTRFDTKKLNYSTNNTGPRDS
jgi:DNA polymerase elongation subunit (family B)